MKEQKYTLAVLPQDYFKAPKLYLEIVKRHQDHLDIQKNITLIYTSMTPY